MPRWRQTRARRAARDTVHPLLADVEWSESNPRFRAAHAVASYLERERVEPLTAGGTVYSDEREILDAERDYWQPRVAVHFGFDFGQGTPRVLVVLNPTARKQTLRALDMRATRSTARSASGSSTARAGRS